MKTKPIISILTVGILATSTHAAAAELSEISFKNNQNDWIEILLENPLTDSLIVKEDSIIAEISPQNAKNKKFVLIYFKSPEEIVTENGEILEIYTTKSGLTGTTEQITIEQNDQIIDAVCWKNSNPPDSEQKDMDALNINCLNSDEISKNQSIAKIAGEWGTLPHPTPGEKNIHKNSPPTAKIDIQTGSTQAQIPFSINPDGSNSSDRDGDDLTYLWQFPDKTIDKKNPPSYRFETAGTYTISLTVTDTFGDTDTTSITITASPKPPKGRSEGKQANKKSAKKSSATPNGDLSTSIEITEIFPNPKGTDTGKEWVELYNSGNSNVNLSNWKINGKKLKNTTIPANAYLSIHHTLKNSKNELILSDFQDTPISKASYPTPKENLSYSKIDDDWFWSKPTESAPNPTYTTITATVTTPPTIAEEFYFTVTDQNQKLHKITFDQDLHSFELLASLFKEGTELELTTDENRTLIEYEILNTHKQQKEETKSYTRLPYLLLGISVLILIFTYTKPRKTPKIPREP